MPRLLHHHHRLLPRTNRRRLRRLLSGPLPAHGWQGSSYRGLLVQEKVDYSCRKIQNDVHLVFVLGCVVFGEVTRMVIVVSDTWWTYVVNQCHGIRLFSSAAEEEPSRDLSRMDGHVMWMMMDRRGNSPSPTQKSLCSKYHDTDPKTGVPDIRLHTFWATFLLFPFSHVACSLFFFTTCVQTHWSRRDGYSKASFRCIEERGSFECAVEEAYPCLLSL